MAASPTPIARTRERLGGAVLRVVGIGLVWLVWRQVAATGRYNMSGAVFAPFGVSVGAALLAVPGDRTERAMRQAASPGGRRSRRAGAL